MAGADQRFSDEQPDQHHVDYALRPEDFESARDYYKALDAQEELRILERKAAARAGREVLAERYRQRVEDVDLDGDQ